MFACCGKRWFSRSKGREEWNLVDSLFATQAPDDILLPTAIAGSVAARVYVDAHDLRCSQSHGFAQGVGHHLVSFVVPMGCAATSVMLISLSYPVTLGTCSHPACAGTWGPGTLQEPGSVLISKASVTTESCEDDWALVKHLSSC